MYPVILQFDIKKGELSIRIGTDTLIVDGFVRDLSAMVHQSVLPSLGQEKIIKKLVANMELKN